MTEARIIKRAKKTGRLQNGVVLCDNCDTPASRSASLAMSWVGCAACMFGEADAIDPKDFIYYSEER